MEPWFSGAVVDAVREAKTRRALFIVYVRDQSEQSEQFNQLWSTVWSNSSNQSNIIALRLDKDTEACKQFIAIYKVENYPTIYFINGQNGQVLKMLDEKIDDANQLNETLGECLKNFEPVKKSVEEKVADARARLKELHEKRDEEANEKEKEDEINRRRLGQQMQLDKQKKQEELIRQQAEELRRDRIEQQKLQEKLKAQIQQDREEKRRKYEEAQPKPASPPSSPTIPKVNYTRSRLQFRLTDGSFFTEDFSSDDHMSNVYQYLQQTLPTDQYQNGSFILRTTHTRVTLERDNPNTLKELELVPTAVLLVINRTNTNSPSMTNAQNSILQSISVLFAWFMMQFNFIYQLIFSKLFGNRTNNNTNTHRQQRSSPAPSTTTRKDNFRTDSTENTTIRRFHNTQDDSDDEEKRTWNGNSTQQM